MGEILASPGGLISRQFVFVLRVCARWCKINGSIATGVASNVMGLLPRGGVYRYGSIATGWRIQIWVYCHVVAYDRMKKSLRTRGI